MNDNAKLQSAILYLAEAGRILDEIGGNYDLSKIPRVDLERMNRYPRLPSIVTQLYIRTGRFLRQGR